MNTLKIILLIFIAFAISRVMLRLKSRELSVWSTIIWLVIWISIVLAVLSTSVSTYVAQLLGIGRGADVAFFLSIIILFYLLFRIYIKIDRIDRDITDVIIKTSIANKMRADQSEGKTP